MIIAVKVKKLRRRRAAFNGPVTCPPHVRRVLFGGGLTHPGPDLGGTDVPCDDGVTEPNLLLVNNTPVGVGLLARSARHNETCKDLAEKLYTRLFATYRGRSFPLGGLICRFISGKQTKYRLIFFVNVWLSFTGGSLPERTPVLLQRH